MQIKKIDVTPHNPSAPIHHRPIWFDWFVGQESIKHILSTAIKSSLTNKHALWHILFSGPSGHGKTTLANIIAQSLNKKIKIITWYAISKPAEMMSILNTLQDWDMLFIDEIHRLKPVIEEMLYIAMEDFAVDMVMPDGGSIRIPLKPFTLVGATTKMESLSDPFKNRFVYKFHLTEYTSEEKYLIILNYLEYYHISTTPDIVHAIERKVEAVPREIHNFCIKIRDYLIAHEHTSMQITSSIRNDIEQRIQIHDGALTPLHIKYLEIITNADRPLGLTTIALQLGIDEQSVEEDVERLLLKLGKIQKTSKGRIVSA